MKWKLIIVMLVLIVIGGLFLLKKQGIAPKNNTQPTQMPKVTKTQHPDWKTFSDNKQGVVFSYPENLSTVYVHPQNWPPMVHVSQGKFSCAEGKIVIGELPGTIAQKKVNGREYCIESVSEGAAGTVFTNYSYTFQKNGELVKLTFSLGYPRCANYELTQRNNCEKERGIFNLDNLIDDITQTLTLNPQ